MDSSSVGKTIDNRSIRVIQFLDAYERQENLWNPSSENYKNKTARDEAYTRIIKDLKIPSLTINDVKLKVKSIRTTYKKELRLLNKHREEGKPYQPKLFWFNRADTFLKNVSVSRNKSLKLEKLHIEDAKPFIIDYVEASDQTGLKENEETIEDAEEGIEQCSIACNSDIETQSQDNVNILEPRPEDSGSLTTKLCYKSSDTKYSNHTISRELNEPLNSVVCNSITVDDEYDFFCRSVAVQLRSIKDNYSRSVAKLKIQQILFEAETGHYRNSACVTIPVGQNLTTM